MKSILKTILVANNPKKWTTYWNQFSAFFKGRDPNFDEVVSFIKDFNAQFDTLPTWEVIYAELNLVGKHDLVGALTDIVQDANLPVFSEDLHFISYLTQQENTLATEDVQRALRQTTNAINVGPKDRNSIFENVEKLQAALHVIRDKSLRAEQSTSTFMTGEQGNNLPGIYQKNVDQRHAGVSNYFPLEFPEMSCLRPKPGDLIVVGGFTSHGKSIWLRYLCYYFAVTYGLNSTFMTFEMGHDDVRVLFSILHANNKKIFPNTPYISYAAFQDGMLSDEEMDFLFNKAEVDLLNNPNYGIIYIDQPNKPRYRLRDLQERIREIETTHMPVHVVAVDYLTMMYPIESDRGQPTASDYNQMFKDFKNTALSHRNEKGENTKFIGLTAAQLSRGGFEEAQKNDGQYEISAFSHYSEIERSSDILLTTYAPPEFRAIDKTRLQNLKNRSGAVQVTPLDLHCSYANGFTLGGMQTRSEAETVEVLQNLAI